MQTMASSTATKPAAASTSKRFELPALDFKFGSLTEGTDIPPPAPSPIPEEIPTPPKTPKDEAEKPNGATGTSPQSNAGKSPSGGTKRPANDNPASPTLSARQGSIRRLFSRNMLHNAYQDGENAAAIQRPESRTSTIMTDTKKSKRSSGWFSRLRASDSAGNKRASMVVTPVTPEKKKPTGPPPPMIPELSELKSSIGAQEDDLSADLFKDIK